MEHWSHLSAYDKKGEIPFGLFMNSANLKFEFSYGKANVFLLPAEIHPKLAYIIRDKITLQKERKVHSFMHSKQKRFYQVIRKFIFSPSK